MNSLTHTPVALHQPDWPDPVEAGRAATSLAGLQPLVEPGQVDDLHAALAQVAGGQGLVLQAGDCAEDPAECTAVSIGRKAAQLHVLSDMLAELTATPVVTVGRVAGQYAKPRSSPTELVDGVLLPTFLGHLVNGPAADPWSRRPDPWRLITGYRAAGRALSHLGWWALGDPPTRPIWASHEALVLDYETPQVRPGPRGPFLSSTHFPWIGERTRRPDGPHVALLAAVVNPVACKVGPTTTVAELLATCEQLDPHRRPGRLTLIARMGSLLAGDVLPALVDAVHAAGHPAVWLCDPMHGNTVLTGRGLKTRPLAAVVDEVRTFRRVLRASGAVAGGLHLETTPDPVTECLWPETDPLRIGDGDYTTLCDPRLNHAQALAVIQAWFDADRAPEEEDRT